MMTLLCVYTVSTRQVAIFSILPVTAGFNTIYLTNINKRFKKRFRDCIESFNFDLNTFSANIKIQSLKKTNKSVINIYITFVFHYAY